MDSIPPAGADRGDAPILDQIAVGRNHLWQSSGRVNLVYTIEDERVGAFDSNRDAVPIKRDPL